MIVMYCMRKNRFSIKKGRRVRGGKKMGNERMKIEIKNISNEKTV